jgi:hypothetical protein
MLFVRMRSKIRSHTPTREETKNCVLKSMKNILMQPARLSGSAGCKLVGRKSRLDCELGLETGAILARREGCGPGACAGGGEERWWFMVYDSCYPRCKFKMQVADKKLVLSACLRSLQTCDMLFLSCVPNM